VSVVRDKQPKKKTHEIKGMGFFENVKKIPEINLFWFFFWKENFQGVLFFLFWLCSVA